MFNQINAHDDSPAPSDYVSYGIWTENVTGTLRQGQEFLRQVEKEINSLVEHLNLLRDQKRSVEQYVNSILGEPAKSESSQGTASFATVEPTLITAKELAMRIGKTPNWVYRHRSELNGRQVDGVWHFPVERIP